ncbi:MAG: Wzz/FepE/Etk N-terminal domain-containing protein [Candidatus Acidiferrum sp.]
MEETFLQLHERREAFSVSLRDVVAPVFRHRRLVAGSFLAIVLGAIVATLVLPKQYQAEMKILVKRELEPTLTSDKTTVIDSRSEVSEEQVQSEVELLRSHDLLENVVKACGLVPALNGKDDREQSVSLARAVRNLERKLQVEPLKKTDLINITYQSQDPELAARVLNTLSSLYLEKHLAVHRLPGAFDFFQKETERYRNELSANEEHLVSFDSEAGLVSPEIEKEIALRKQSEFDAALRETRTDIAETSHRISALEDEMIKTAPRITTLERTSDNPMLEQQLKSTLLNLELKRTELLSKFAPEYPLVQEVQKQIAQAEAAIAAAEQSPLREQTTDRDPTYAWMREELAKDRSQLIALRARAEALAPVVQTYQIKTHSLDEKGATQEDLVRAAKAAEQNYLLYLQKQEEARISDALDRNRIVNVAIAEAATVPALPTRSPLLTLLLGGLLATCLSLGSAYAADYLDPSFRTPQELYDTLDVPVLAAVPREGR